MMRNNNEKRPRIRGKMRTPDTDRTLSNDDIDKQSEKVFTNKEKMFIRRVKKLMEPNDLVPTPPTKGDGNCFFRSVADQVIIREIEDKARNHKALRLEVSYLQIWQSKFLRCPPFKSFCSKANNNYTILLKVCDHIKKLPAPIKEEMVNTMYNGRKRGLSDLAYRQRKANQWVDDNVMVVATSYYLARNIWIYGPPAAAKGNTEPSVTKIECGAEGENHPPVTIFFHNNHYQTLSPIPI